MIVLFYDRKNKRQVRSDQLMKTKVGQSILVVDNDGENFLTEGDVSVHVTTMLIGSLAYKSENCSPSCNWDLFLNETDLVYLGIVD